MTMTGTQYDLLGVSRAATAPELKAAYRRLMRSCHPDLAGAGGAAMSQRVNAAYTVLSDPAARRDYDFEIREPAAPERTAPVPQPSSGTPTPQEHAAKTATGRHPLTVPVVLTALAAAALFALVAEWMNPSMPASGARLGLLVVAVAALRLISGRRRIVSRLVLTFGGLIGPLGLLGWAPFATLAAQTAPLALLAMTVLGPLIWGARRAWRMLSTEV